MTEVNIYRRGVVATNSRENGLRTADQQPFMTSCSCTLLDDGDFKLEHNGEIVFIKNLTLKVTLVAAGSDESYEYSVVDQTVSVKAGTIYKITSGDGLWQRSVNDGLTAWNGDGQYVEDSSEYRGERYHAVNYPGYMVISYAAFPKYAVPTTAFGLTATSAVRQTGVYDTSSKMFEVGNHGYVKIHIVTD